MIVNGQDIEFNEETMERMGVNEYQWEMILAFVSEIETLKSEVETLKRK